jgi:hypothetical protein
MTDEERILKEVKAMQRGIIDEGSKKIKGWIYLEKDIEKKEFLNIIYNLAMEGFEEGINNLTLKI